MFSNRSNIQPVDPANVPVWAFEIDNTMYCQLALATVLVYDTITRMDKEVKYFWSTPRKFVSLIYFLNRYIGLFGAVAYLWCTLIRLRAPMCPLTFYSFELADILYMRVMALFSQGMLFLHRKLSICLQAIFVAEAASMIVILIYVNIHEMTDVGGLAKGVTICGEDTVVPVVWGILFWTSPVVYELILMVLALYKAAGFWRTSAGFQGFYLVKVLIQDQALYFILVITCSVARAISFQRTFDLVFVSFLNAIGSASLLCILGSWLLVHLKEAGEKGINGGTSYRPASMSDLEFA
ncbi:hypothetical protein DFH11DRAFT_1711036 [Phellopilus nigrolimitatus]|nr:hypothetical protein DFH11DRAFT_1711036 [Phellopilus nigrolimitatus]